MRTNPFLQQTNTEELKKHIEKMLSVYSERTYMIITGELSNNTFNISQEILFILLFGKDKARNIRI